MAEQYYEYEDDEPGQGGGGHLFLWTVFILLLIGYPVAYALALAPRRWQGVLVLLVVLPF